MSVPVPMAISASAAASGAGAIHAVADEGDFSVRAQMLHRRDFAVRQNARDHFVDAELRRDGPRGLLVVAGDDYGRDADLMQGADRRDARRLDRIGDRQDRPKLPVDASERRLALPADSRVAISSKTRGSRPSFVM